MVEVNLLGPVIVNLRKIHDSLHLTIPAKFCRALKLKAGDPCTVKLEENHLVLSFALSIETLHVKGTDVLYDPFSPQSAE